LSLEVARESLLDFPEGVFFVPLAPLSDPSLIASAILQVLGYAGMKGLPADRQVLQSIGNKRLLIIFDNCEHLIDEVSVLASDLLLACSHLNILATSREALRIPGEWLYPVPPLGVPEESSTIDLQTIAIYPALTLFAERARAVRPDFTLNTENVQNVASICAKLDGLPLAIELVAARIRLMSPQTLLDRLTEEFILSADGMRAVSVRQKTLNNAIGWSFELLSQDDKKIFAGLSVFRGGFSLQIAETVLKAGFPGKNISDHITSLLDKSLLQRKLDSLGEPRFHMLVTIKQFASESLRQFNEEVNARNSHLDYYLGLAEKGAQEIRGLSQVEWANHTQIEHENFRAALEWTVSNQMTETALRLLYALGWPWEIQGHYREAYSWFEKIRALPDISNYPVIYARVLNHIGRHCWTQDNFRDAYSLLKESRDICRELGEGGEQILADTLAWLGLSVLTGNSDANQAKSLFEEGRKLAQKWGDQHGFAINTFHLGIAERELGQDEKSQTLLEESLSLFQQFGDLFFIARVSLFLGYHALKKGEYDNARSFFEEHLRIDQELLFWDGIAEGWRDLGNLYRQQGNYEKAEKFYEQSRAVCREHGLTKTVP
jgi:predicted ATPase